MYDPESVELVAMPEYRLGETIEHYGVARRSGRYPWGSGDDPYQRTGSFASRVRELKRAGFTYTDENGVTYKGDTAIAKYWGIGPQEFRAAYSMSKDDERILKIDTAKGLLAKGYTQSETARKMGMNESTLRSLLNKDSEAKTREAQSTADFIKEHVEKYGMVDVGQGVASTLNISREKLNEALFILEGEGYHTVGANVDQANSKDHKTRLRVVLPKDTPVKEKNGVWVSSAIYDYDKIHYLTDYTSHDDGATFDKKWVYPASMDSKRLSICYAEDGGIKKDGLIEIRPNVPDLSLGSSTYAQVRILVDGSHYLKGMAVYNPDLPEGVDVRFNTNKSRGTPALGEGKKTVLKQIKNEDESPGNPFGSLIKAGIVDPKKSDAYEGGQSYWYDDKGEKHLSLINKRAEEGDWGEWADKLSSQFLAKQNIPLIRRQLGKSMDKSRAELDDILALDNPVVKKNLLESFALECDYTSVHMEAEALPRQKYQVILPLTSISNKEIYAPNYEDGEQVALIRYPHGGLFEIPVLTVNNRNREGKRVMGKVPKDAVGISSTVAEQLSGADFDGDTVMVIPFGHDYKISHKDPLPGLKDFDPKMQYPYREGMKVMTKGATGNEMGKISNLIMDMTLQGAPPEDLEKAVKHSMVVIDAHKHKLDYKRSEQENDIKTLKVKYQGITDPETGKVRTPSGTLLTRAKSPTSIRKHQGSPKIDPETGDLVWKETEDHKWKVKVDKVTGEKTWIETDKYRTQSSTQMADTKDARTLISKTHTQQEIEYANYANYMKALAREARLAYLNTHPDPKNPSAAVTYKKEVDSLMANLKIAERNRPKERQAQLIVQSKLKALREANPDMDEKDERKRAQMFLTEARAKVGAKRFDIPISDREWEAIQAGAISASSLNQILQRTDMARVRELSTPKNTKTISAAKIDRINLLAAQNKFTVAEIAEQMGLSVSTVNKYMK